MPRHAPNAESTNYKNEHPNGHYEPFKLRPSGPTLSRAAVALCLVVVLKTFAQLVVGPVCCSSRLFTTTEFTTARSHQFTRESFYGARDWNGRGRRTRARRTVRPRLRSGWIRHRRGGHTRPRSSPSRSGTRSTRAALTTDWRTAGSLAASYRGSVSDRMRSDTSPTTGRGACVPRA